MKTTTPILTAIFLVTAIASGLHFANIKAEDAGGAAFFSDVEHQSYYDAPAATMARKGIVKGYDDGRFGPNDPVTRGQVVTILDRYDQSVVQPLRDQIAKLRDMMDLGRCGDGQKQIGEQCDDGNLVNGDGCSAECLKEVKPEPITELEHLPVTCPGGYKVGESFPADDGCNTCVCEEGGIIACTLMACDKHPVRCPSDSKVCPDGSTVSRNPSLNCEFDPCPEVASCKQKEQELADFIRSHRACRTDDDCSVLVRKCSPYLTCGKPVSTGAIGDVKIAIADYIMECSDEEEKVCADCAARGAVCERGFCRLDPPYSAECGNGICEEGEADKVHQAEGCDPDLNPLCIGTPAYLEPGTCPEDCTETEGGNCATYIRDGEDLEVCATCGDGVCDSFENCTSSNCSEEACTNDCGPLYCPDDCE